MQKVELTARQLECARAVARGRTIDEAAQELGISLSTAKQHIARVRVLFGVSRTRQIIERLEELESTGRLEVRA